MSRIILSPGQNGLVDSLIFSSLPERFSRERNTDVYIRQMNWRNQGIPDLVWVTNPFVKGIAFVSDMPNKEEMAKGVGWDDITRLSIEHGSSALSSRFLALFLTDYWLLTTVFSRTMPSPR